MRKSKISNAQRLDILAQWDVGASIDELCRTYQISAATLYNWRKAKAEDEDETKRRLKELEQKMPDLKRCSLS